MAKGKNKAFLFFFLAIVGVSVLMFVQDWRRRRVPRLAAAGNKGIGSLVSLDGGGLAAVFMDGRTCVWDWAAPYAKQAEWKAAGGRAMGLSEGRLATVGQSGQRRMLTIYTADGKKVKELAVGWEDQDIFLVNSPKLGMPTVVRRNAERNGVAEVEFMIVDLAAELLRPPVVLTLEVASQTLRDVAVSDAGVLYAVGADGGQGRVTAFDLNTGQTLWEVRLADVQELTAVTVSADGATVWAGDRGANLLELAAADGRLLRTVSLLMPGETRTVTNDYSVLNLVSSRDGRRLGCTVAPVAYAVDAETGQVLRRMGGHKVVAKVAFSPDGQKAATADLRADGTVNIHMLGD